MSIWKVNTFVRRGYDSEVDFFPAEKGFKEYFFFGVPVYKKEFDSSTEKFVMGKSKKSTGIGFKNE